MLDIQFNHPFYAPPPSGSSSVSSSTAVTNNNVTSYPTPPQTLHPPCRFDWHANEDWTTALDPQQIRSTQNDTSLGQYVLSRSYRKFSEPFPTDNLRRSSLGGSSNISHLDMPANNIAYQSQGSSSLYGFAGTPSSSSASFSRVNAIPHGAIRDVFSSQSQPTSRPESPEFQSCQSTAGGSGPSSIAPYLQLPSTISPNGGSLAEFAAKITCLFWFESAPTLTQIEEGLQAPAMTARLDTGFLKWVTTILTTTQVSPNVILLALLFIYRLKRQNPTVKGKPGSEFRLLTVALMLGNKFLDDNTYTNKTWAEVSGIAVQEIHVMEVEFLSHMKYNLYTSKEQWLHWHRQLRAFHGYFDQLSRQREFGHRGSLSLRPLNLAIPHSLPSPPQSTSASPPFLPSAAIAAAGSSSSPMPWPAVPAIATHQLGPSLSPSTSISEYDPRYAPRKRSWDETAFTAESAPAPKRLYGQQHTHPVAPGSDVGATSVFSNMPNLPVPVSHQAAIAAPGIHLPIPTPSSARNTPTVSLPPVVNWTSQSRGPATPTRRGSGAFLATSSSKMPVGKLPSSSSSFAFSNSANPSPTSQPYLVAPTRQLGGEPSPTQFLQHRQSPYRPIRNISTLLVPPPSGHMPSQQHIPQNQMSWMPLGRQNDVRSGRVPYLHRDAWPQANQVGEWSAMNHPVRQQG